MQDDFKTLFRRRQEKKLTEAEERSLMKMLASGEYSAELDALLVEPAEVGDREVLVSAEQYYKDYNAVIAEIGTLPDQKSGSLLPRQVFAIAAAVLLILVTLVWIFQSLGDQRQPTTITSDRYMRSFNLPDGTAVTLNEGSSLTYFSDFKGKIREVLLLGEAYFDVAHRPNHPFIVRTRDVSTTVLGTAFNIKAYQKESKIIVTVMRGEVCVGYESFIFSRIMPNEEISVDATSLKFQKSKVVADKAIAWKQAKGLVMDNVTMLEATRMIAKHFGIKVMLSNKSLEPCRISASFDEDENLENVLAALSMAKRGSYVLEKGEAVIEGTCD